MNEPTPAGSAPVVSPTTGPTAQPASAPTPIDLPPFLNADLPAANPDDIAKTYDLAAKVFGDGTRRQDDELFHEATRKSLGWGDTVDDMGHAVMNGFEDFGQAVATPVLNTMTGQNRETKTENTEATRLGSLTNTISQQLPALLPISKALSLGRVAWAGSKVLGSEFAATGLAKFFTLAATEFSANAVAFGGKEEKLSDTLAPMFKDTALGPVLSYIKTDPTGSEAMNRARNGIENMGLGLAMTGLLKGASILARRAFAKEAGVAAETIAKNTVGDIAQFRSEYPTVAAKIDEAMKTGANMTEEEAFSAVMAVSSKFASEGGEKADNLAKLLTFVNGDNEAKAAAVDAALTPEQAAAKVDQEFQDFYAVHGRRLEAQQKLDNPTHVGPSGETFITPPPHDPDLRKFNAWRKSEGVTLPSSGEPIVTPPPKKPVGLLDYNRDPQLSAKIDELDAQAGDWRTEALTARDRKLAKVIDELDRQANGTTEESETVKFLKANREPTRAPAADESPVADKPAVSPSDAVNGVGTPEAAPSMDTMVGRLYDKLSSTAKREIAEAKPADVETAVFDKAKAEGIRIHEDELDAIDIARETRLKAEAKAAGKPKTDIDAIKIDARHPDSIWNSASKDADQFIDETEPEEWAGNWPALGNTRRATKGLSDTAKQAFHTVRTFVAQFKDVKGNSAYPTEKQIISGMKAHAATLDKASAPELKARLAKLTSAEVDDFLDRIDAYYGGNDPVEVTAADVSGIKPKSEVVDIDGESRVVQTYGIQADGRQLRVHAEHLPDGKYGLSISVPNNTVVKAKNADEVRVGWRTIDLQKKVDRADLPTAVADAATQSQRYYKIDASGSPKGWAEVVDGRGVIGLFKTANVSDLVHELTHAYDLLDVAPKFMGRLRQSLGFAVDDRSKDAAEAVAQAFEHFAYKGELDAAWKKPGFQKLSQFMSAVYKDVEKTPVGMEITEPVRMAFRGFGELKAIGDNVGVRPELEELKSRLIDTDFNDPDARQAIFDKATETYLNLGTIRGDDAQTITAQLTDVFDHVIQADRGGVETHKAAVQDAVSMMLNNGGSLSTLSEITRGAEHLREIGGKFLYWRGMTQSWADQVGKTLKAVRSSPNDSGLQKQFEIAFDSFTRMRMLMQDIQTESGRLLGKHKIVMPSLPVEEDLAGVGYAALMDADKKSGGKLLNQFEALIKSANGDPMKATKSITDISRSVKNKTYMNLAKSIYMSSILSHPRVVLGTQLLAGVVGSVTKPAQYVMGGVAHMDPESVRFGLDLYKNLAHTAWDFVSLTAEGKEGWQDIGRTFARGASVSEHDAIPYLRPSDVYTGMAGVVKHALDGSYAVATSPLRTMNTMDEMFRQIYGRAYLRTRGMNEAFANGLKHGTPEFEDAVHKFVQAGFDSDGAILDPQTIQELQSLTFKRPLRESTNPAIRGIDAFSKIPGMWLFQPLLRAPVNIGREAAMSVPGIQYMSRSFREGLRSSNPQIAAAFRGRQVMGLMTLGLFGTLAYNGNITGAGPSRTSAEGKRWYDAGNQPYSFIVRNGDGTVTSIGYQQIEPFSTVAALCANAAETLDQSDVPDDKKEHVAAALAAGLGKTWSDKRYLTGLAAALQVLNGDAAAAKRSLAQIMAGAVPLSGAQAFVSDLTDDDDFKHAQGLLEQVQNRTLFKSQLEPRRDFFGQPVQGAIWNNVSPLPVRTTSGDSIVEELRSLGNRVPDTSSTKLRGLDLMTYQNAKGQSSYDRRAELRGEVKLGGHTLHESLGRLMASSAYKSLSGDFDSLKNERADRVNKVVEHYNATIQTQLLSEFPDLKRAYFAADPSVKRQQSQKAVAALVAIPK